RRFIRQNRGDAIEPERDAAVWRSAILQRLEEEPEAQLRFFNTDVEQRKDPAPQGGIVYTDAAATDLASVQHQIVRLRTDGPRFAVQPRDVRIVRRRER